MHCACILYKMVVNLQLEMNYYSIKATMCASLHIILYVYCMVFFQTVAGDTKVSKHTTPASRAHSILKEAVNSHGSTHNWQLGRVSGLCKQGMAWHERLLGSEALG